MKLYTFQPNFIWEAIQKDGFYHPFDLFEKDEFLKNELNQSWGFIKAYDWLKEKMLQNGIVHKQHNDHLIWAWYQWYGNKNKPDKRYSSVYAFHDQPFVMMELEIDPSRVFLTDYDAWHYVLNYWLLAKEKEVENFSKSYNYYKEKPLNNKKADLKVQQSWDVILDFDKCRTLLEYSKEQQSIQATFFEIFKEDVKKVHYFENNKCTKIETLY